MRRAEMERKTGETEISLKLDIDGAGEADIETGSGFFNHMLRLFARHGRFDIILACKGDTEVDAHHTVEDVGIVLGRTFSQALGNRAGIARYGSMLLPMDEALVMVALDISGRAGLNYALEIPAQKIGEFDSELVQEFFVAFVREFGLTLHLRQIAGQNSHHIAEAAFKGVARALAQAVKVDTEHADEIPSTKGTIL